MCKNLSKGAHRKIINIKVKLIRFSLFSESKIIILAIFFVKHNIIKYVTCLQI